MDSNYESIENSCSSKDYRSNYDTDIDIDLTYKNKLFNISNDNDILFDLKNAIFINHGTEIYNDIVNIYDDVVKNINFEIFDEGLWNNVVDLYSRLQNDEVNCYCFSVFFKPVVDNRQIREMYNYLFDIKINCKKIKILSTIYNRYLTNGLIKPCDIYQ